VKITCVGGGPAGLYFAISLKRRDPAHRITVLEWDPRGATYGWGVVYWAEALSIDVRDDQVPYPLTPSTLAWPDADLIVGADGAQWTQFTEVTNTTWHHRDTVLIGDAAHTTHFTIGSGTRLAMVGTVTLAQSIYEHPGATTAREPVPPVSGPSATYLPSGRVPVSLSSHNHDHRP
jgi:2-polyprenyl-6-methoxyphenol hydroxylase-like FAD-dependent oxidoreductase